MKIFMLFLAIYIAVAIGFENKTKIDQRFCIVGGQTIVINKAPYISSISGRDYMCTGIILPKVSILTSYACALMCESEKILSDLYCQVSVGSGWIENSGNWVTEYIYNPYAKIAILRTQITFSERVKKINISDQNLLTVAQVIVSGFNTESLFILSKLLLMFRIFFFFSCNFQSGYLTQATVSVRTDNKFAHINSTNIYACMESSMTTDDNSELVAISGPLVI